MIVPVDPLSCATLAKVQQFDIYLNGYTNMIEYLSNVAEGTVLVSITMRNPSLQAAANQPLVDALKDLGVFAADVNIRGSVVFIVQKGYNKTLFSKSLYSTYPSATLSAIVGGKLTVAFRESHYEYDKHVTTVDARLSLKSSHSRRLFIQQ